ncbi:PREDICTED: microfibrillar-associated protein 5 [Chrysochloris asiatica]|uniref:Microfibrillar-associated protein 5 n=1 Tax=Chrysochloris asiatica TaxID=185453 RepID=A0A9B0X240_CHRAS|nr:PREDICTED: microfibrillar-associated protein 5 [Chrysochloris asiatica]
MLGSVLDNFTYRECKGARGRGNAQKYFLIFFSDDVTQVTQEPFTEDPNLVNDPSTDETVLADIEPSTDDLASPNDKNTTTECRDEKFPCTRLYSVHRPVKQCIHQLCLTSLRRMYIINNEICSRLVCKEHEAMKDELCRQMAGLPPRRLRRSNYFRLPPCENLDLQRPNGL